MSQPEGPAMMEKLVSLCKRRGFVYPASSIYGGINGFWDYGPLGVQLKNNLRDAWWKDMVECPPVGPDGEQLQIVGLDSSIIQNPKTWEASGHLSGFNDPMVDCKLSKRRYRADHLMVAKPNDGEGPSYAYLEGESDSIAKKLKKVKRSAEQYTEVALIDLPTTDYSGIIGPDTKEPGSLTEPRQFNLMFKTYVGARATEDDIAYLRPETAQGIFLNYKNVMDSSRVSMPFGIAQIGKAFRNEVTPRNFIFRSREFEQMEMEFFCHPDDAVKWFNFWAKERLNWWIKQGVSEDKLILREHDRDELAHYAKEGAGTYDVEYKYPFSGDGHGELEGIAHRSNFDLTQHQTHSKTKLEYVDQARGNERYVPHVIEPAAGLTRGLLVLLCEAYTVDENRPSPEIMKFHPRLAPVKAGVFPLTKKDGLPELAHDLYRDLAKRWPCQFDAKQSIGKRYARMDEAGAPYCFTVDHDSLTDQTVTVRDRDTGAQERMAMSKVAQFVEDKINS